MKLRFLQPIVAIADLLAMTARTVVLAIAVLPEPG
jgi:hypothetical protein